MGQMKRTPSAAAVAAAAAPAAPPQLSDSVQRTCSGACALRALELLCCPDRALIRDMLALTMAGPDQLKAYGERWQAWEAAEGPGRHSYFAGRARVVDELVEEAAAALAAGGGRGSHVQVVSLGAGMDTRPWRLNLPPGTVWFDVDQEPVITLKTRLLGDAGAELAAAEAAAAKVEDAPVQPQPAATANGVRACGCWPLQLGRGGRRAGRFPGLDMPDSFPLKCAVDKQVVCNLEQKGDVQGQLRAAGLDPKLPTVWVAEGLCYYLSLAANEDLLRCAAASTPRGSRLIATHIPAVNLEANRTCPETSPLARLFTVSIDDVQRAKLLQKTQWVDVAVTGDIAEVISERCSGAKCYYPYSLAYSDGKPLSGIECIVQATRK